eukprot:4268146-Prymnesium_polylepis.1
MQRRGGVRRVAPWSSTTVPFALERAASFSTFADFGSGSGCGWVVGVTTLVSGRAERAWCDGLGLPRQPVVALKIQKAIPPLWVTTW